MHPFFSQNRKRKPLEEGEANAAKSPPPKKAKGETPSAPTISTTPPIPHLPLLVMQTSPEACSKFISILTGTQTLPTKNQSLAPIIRSLTDADLLFPQQLDQGHCKALYTRTRVAGGGVREELKLQEGGSNSDSPRFVAREL